MEWKNLITLISLVLSTAVAAYEIISKRILERKTLETDTEVKQGSVQEQGIENLAKILETWQQQYEELSQITTENQREIGKLLDERQQLRLDLEQANVNLAQTKNSFMEQMEFEIKQRQGQAALLIELRKELDKTKTIVNEQKKLIEKLSSENARFKRENEELKVKLNEANERIKALEDKE